MDVEELLEEIPYFDVVVDAQSWGERRGEDEFAVVRVDRLISWSPSERPILPARLPKPED